MVNPKAAILQEVKKLLQIDKLIKNSYLTILIMKDTECQEAIPAVEELVSRVENEKLTCTEEIRMKELSSLIAMYTKEIEILTGEQDETFLGVLDKVHRLYIPFIKGIVDPVVNYKIKLNEDIYPLRMSTSVALSCLNELIVPSIIKKEDELLKIYNQEDYILTFISNNSSLYESVLDKVKQLYAPLIRHENTKG